MSFFGQHKFKWDKSKLVGLDQVSLWRLVKRRVGWVKLFSKGQASHLTRPRSIISIRTGRPTKHEVGLARFVLDPPLPYINTPVSHPEDLRAAIIRLIDYFKHFINVQGSTCNNGAQKSLKTTKRVLNEKNKVFCPILGFLH